MDYFTVTVTPDTTDGTKAYVTARFSGGASDYSYKKLMYLTVQGMTTYTLWSAETSGGENTFSYTIEGLTPGTAYSWSASLYVRVSGGWGPTDYTDSGSFVTASSGGGTTIKAVVNIGNETNPNWLSVAPIINVGNETYQNWQNFYSVNNYGNESYPNWR